MRPKTNNPRELLCNLCGGFMCPLGGANKDIPHGLYNAKVQGGYDSYHLFDFTTYVFSLCELCLRNLFIQCRIKPHIESYIGGGSSDFRDDQEAYEYRIWQDTGGFHQAYIDGKCNFKKDCSNQAIYSQFERGIFTEYCSCEKHKDLGDLKELVQFVPHSLRAFL